MCWGRLAPTFSLAVARIYGVPRIFDALRGGIRMSKSRVPSRLALFTRDQPRGVRACGHLLAFDMCPFPSCSGSELLAPTLLPRARIQPATYAARLSLLVFAALRHMLRSGTACSPPFRQCFPHDSACARRKEAERG